MPNVPTDSLIYYYKFDDLTDSFGSNDLTATNSPAFAAGKIGNAIDLESSSQQHLSCADNANLSTGDINFSGDVWIKMESKDVNKYIVGKLTGASLEWTVDYLQSSDRFRFYIRSAGGTFVVAVANSLGSPSLAVWYHIYFEHDATNNFVRIRVNNGTTDSVATSGTAPPDTTAPLRFGYVGSGTTQHFDGLIDEAAFWKRVLTSQEQADRYNGGDGNTLIVDGISITEPRSPEIIAMDDDGLGGTIDIVGAYEFATTPPTAIECRHVWTNPSDTGDWEVIDDSPSGGAFSGSYYAPIGSGALEFRWANDTGVTYTLDDVGVGLVLVTGGQSNMQGRADSLQALTNPGSQLALMLREDDTAWSALADPTNSDAVYGTLIPHVATQWLADNPDCPIAFITACDGGTSILISPFEWQIPSGASYVDLLASVTVAGNKRINGVLWLQGEAEAYFDYSTEDYYDAVITVIEALHALPGNPWVMVGQIGMLPASEVAGAHAIRQAQRNTWRIDYVRPGPSWQDMQLSVDQLHARTDAESEEQGTRWGKALSGATPPVMIAIYATPGTDTVTIRYDQTLTTDASLSTAPWSLSSGQTVSAASASGDLVTLTVSPDNEPGVLSVTHAEANTAVGVDVPMSLDGLPAAAETFVQTTVAGGVSQPSALSPQFSPSFGPTLPSLLTIVGG
jgi:hypothetical protein